MKRSNKNELLSAAIDVVKQVNSGDGDHFVSYARLEKAIKNAKAETKPKRSNSNNLEK